MKVRDFSKLYFGILIIHLAAIYRPESEALYLISKPALLFSLLSFFIHRTQEIGAGNRWPVIIALAASLVGDVLLMNTGESNFLMGMGAFAVAQLGYALFYLRQPLNFKPLAALAGLVIFAAAFWFLYNFIPVSAELRLYIYAYAALLGLHLIFSTRMLSAGFSGSYWPVAGALLFMLSDLSLAYGKFVDGSKYLQIVVMLTYALAQYGIAIGVLKFMWQNNYGESSGEVARKAS